MGWGDFSSTNSILLPDVEYIIGQDIAKKYDYTTTVIHRVVPELVKGSYNNRVYFFEDIVFRDKRQMKYTELPVYTKELIDSLDIAGQCALIIDGTGVGEPVYDLYEDAFLDPLKIIFGSGNQVSTQRQRETTNWSTSKFGAISAFVVPKDDLVGALQVYVQQGKLRTAEGLAFEVDAKAQYQNFIGRINEKTKYVKYGNADDEVHDDIVVSDAMCCWYTQHMKKLLSAKPLDAYAHRKDSYQINPFEEDDPIWQ